MYQAGGDWYRLITLHCQSVGVFNMNVKGEGEETSEVVEGARLLWMVLIFVGRKK